MCSRAQVATLPRLGELVSLRGASNPCGPVKQYNCALLRCDEQASVHLRLPGRAHVQIVEEVVNVPFEAADGLRVHEGGFEGRAVMVSLQHPDDKPEAMLEVTDGAPDIVWFRVNSSRQDMNEVGGVRIREGECWAPTRSPPFLQRCVVCPKHPNSSTQRRTNFQLAFRAYLRDCDSLGACTALARTRTLSLAMSKEESRHARISSPSAPRATQKSTHATSRNGVFMVVSCGTTSPKRRLSITHTTGEHPTLQDLDTKIRLLSVRADSLPTPCPRPTPLANFFRLFADHLPSTEPQLPTTAPAARVATDVVFTTVSTMIINILGLRLCKVFEPDFACRLCLWFRACVWPELCAPVETRVFQDGISLQTSSSTPSHAACCTKKFGVCRRYSEDLQSVKQYSEKLSEYRVRQYVCPTLLSRSAEPRIDHHLRHSVARPWNWLGRISATNSVTSNSAAARSTYQALPAVSWMNERKLPAMRPKMTTTTHVATRTECWS